MASSTPRVSIIMPTYNWSGVLPYSIGSVQLQTLADFELLVIGDGCTDDSAEVVGAIGDARVRWIGLEENSGHQSAPANEGLRQARGKIIAYLGHDDLWLPDHLASLVQAIDTGADLAWTVTRWVSPDLGDDPLFLLSSYTAGAFIPPSSVAHRRAVTECIGGWTDYRQIREFPETDLLRRADAAGFCFAFVPRLTVVKFPAGRRRNVYRERPHHEQAAWLERIREEPDLATAELLDVVAENVPPSRMFYRDLVHLFWCETWRRLRRRLISPKQIGTEPGAAVDALKKIKGLKSRKLSTFAKPDQMIPPVEGEAS